MLRVVLVNKLHAITTTCTVCACALAYQRYEFAVAYIVACVPHLSASSIAVKSSAGCSTSSVCSCIPTVDSLMIYPYRNMYMVQHLLRHGGSGSSNGEAKSEKCLPFVVPVFCSESTSSSTWYGPSMPVLECLWISAQPNNNMYNNVRIYIILTTYSAFM